MYIVLSKYHNMKLYLKKSVFTFDQLLLRLIIL